MLQENPHPPFDFESAIMNIKKIITQMETNPLLSIEESVKKFKQAKQLIEICQKKLSQAEQEVNIVCENQIETTLKPYHLENETISS